MIRVDGADGTDGADGAEGATTVTAIKERLIFYKVAQVQLTDRMEVRLLGK